MTSALTYILFSLLVLSSGTIVPQCCLRDELFKTLPSLYHRVHKCFEGPLMLKYLRITSVQGFERLWIWWKHLELIFFQIPPPPQKNVLGANVQTSTIFYEISKHFDKATCLNTQVHFHFQLSQNVISTRFWMTPIDTAILVAAKTAITIWQKTGTDSRRGLERVYLHTAYCIKDVTRTCQGGWTEQTQQLMKESFPEKFVLMALVNVVTTTLRSTYGIAALSWYTDWNQFHIATAATVEKVRGWNTNLLFKDTVHHWTLTFSRLFSLPFKRTKGELHKHVKNETTFEQFISF